FPYKIMTKKTLQSLCVYCGASTGHDPIYAAAANQLAQGLVENKIALVYGGGQVGLMGKIADAVLALGGHVTGVIPKALMETEVGHHHLTELIIVDDMHARKAKMAELSDGFIAMPGGIGTLEELFEVLTWAQLGFHEKPIGLLNTANFFNGLIDFLQHQVQQGFLRAEHAELLLVDTDSNQLITKLQHFEMKAGVSWLSRQAARTLGP
ncbi:MAG: hypothetical protein RI984_521, partial [Pseudomonadota bacterium]